jgi:hypothetical protein
MSRQTFPVFVDQPGCTMRNFRVTGADVSTTPGSAGLDGRGQFLCTISVGTGGTANQLTINWVPSFGDVPYVIPQPSAGQLNTLVQIVTSTASQLVINTVEADSNATPVTSANLDFLVCSYDTTSFVS